jgi:uncharacterized protein (DUF488 family)
MPECYRKCYTLGYLDHCTPADLAGYLVLFDALLVDIRLTPYSQNPLWRQEALRRRLGADYHYCHALGNRNYKQSGAPIVLFAPAEGLRQLRPILAVRPVILLCACREWEQCHRRVAAEYLAGVLDLEVEHLPGDVTRWAES